jgi:hypothetical protein
VVTVAPEFLSEFFEDFVDVGGSEICEADVHRFLESELLSEFSGLPRRNVKDAGKRERVAAVRVFSAVNLETGMVHSESHVSGVVVGPEHVVDVEDDRFAGSVVFVGFTGRD